MILRIERRQFISVLGAASLCPFVAHAQQEAMPVIGSLHPGAGEKSEYFARMFSSFNQGLKENGFLAGQNVTIESRWAEGHNDRLPELAADLVRRRVAAIFAAGGLAPVRAAMAATASIPIVFVSAADPVEGGLVASLNRPGGNVTGVAMISSSLEAKRLGQLHELLPHVSTIAVIVNPNNPTVQSQARQVQEAAAGFGLKSFVVGVGTESDIAAAFAGLVQQGAGAALVVQDPFFVGEVPRFSAQAARYAVPVMYSQRDYVTAGGLISYGADFADGFHQAGIYAGKILNGEKPADLPIVEPTKFEMFVNLKTAKTLGINVPQTILVSADEVIE
jgi:putative ABC transport system substrate-binding protein